MCLSLFLRLAFTFLLTALACARDPQVEARAELARRGLEFTPEVFFTQVRKGEVEAVRLFLAAGMSPHTRDKRGNAALILAAQHGKPEIIALLLDKGAERETRDPLEGRTPLLWAVARNRLEAVALLLERGAEVAAADRHGRNVAVTAALYSRADLLALLADKGVPLSGQDAQGRTLLMLAATAGRADNVRLLLERGADPNARDPKGRTALMLAAMAGRREAVKALLEGGADADLTDQEGKKALDLAKEDEELMKLLFLAEKSPSPSALRPLRPRPGVRGHAPLSPPTGKFRPSFLSQEMGLRQAGEMLRPEVLPGEGGGRLPGRSVHSGRDMS
ncbi:MAG: ankyrin repeat domain-containing protein [Syntrophobacterales bacterium]|nr:ankyrin repeat domain-containing protein [Syntrophobacterales bacterium]